MDRPYEADIPSGYIKNGYGIYGAWIRKKKNNLIPRILRIVKNKITKE